MFSEELKEITAHVHQGLEKKLVSQIRGIKSIEDYILLLELMYGYYQPLQDEIQPYLSGSSQENLGRQAANIINDIKALAPHHDLTFRVCTDIPALPSGAAILGALYVTEGSTLGGRYITKMISKQLAIPPDEGFTFFNSYGNDTEMMWQKFKSVINQPKSNIEKQEMIQAAMNTFKKFNDWITLYEQGPN